TKRFSTKNLEPLDYLKDWTGCIFCSCFDLPDLIKIWDSILAIKLNTMTHQALKTSKEDDSNPVLDYLSFKMCPKYSLTRFFRLCKNKDSANINVNQIIQESLLLWQQHLAEDLNDELPFRPFSRAQTKIDDKEIEDEPFWEEDFEKDGFNKYKGPWLDVSDFQEQNSLQKIQNHADGQHSFLSKLRSKAKGWKDSNAAATVQLPAMSSNTSSDQASSSCFSPQLESPLQSNYHKDNANLRGLSNRF
ncbi:hypothetical protein PPACK8108_LOCUS3833, partial [Phakopsora pachyrhizi]